MEILVKVLQFFMSLTLLVAVHEFGHFIVARIFKIRVEKFYIFFDAGFSLWKKKWGDTAKLLVWSTRVWIKSSWQAHLNRGSIVQNQLGNDSLCWRQALL